MVPKNKDISVIEDLIDTFRWYENICLGLHGGEFNYFAWRLPGKGVQTEALRCTAESSFTGAFCVQRKSKKKASFGGSWPFSVSGARALASAQVYVDVF